MRAQRMRRRYCAVVGNAPDPNGGLPDIRYAQVWADGDWQATENRNRKLLEKSTGSRSVSRPPVMMAKLVGRPPVRFGDARPHRW